VSEGDERISDCKQKRVQERNKEADLLLKENHKEERVAQEERAIRYLSHLS